MTATVPPVPSARRRFVLDNTRPVAPAHVPEILLHTATEAHELWHATEEELGRMGLPPPFWAFAWAGGQGLARYLIDNPDAVKDRRVLDFASGSGLVAIAAHLCGAQSVTASDTDPFSHAAIALNAALNGVELAIVEDDLLLQTAEQLRIIAEHFDIVLAGDVFYDRTMSAHALEFFRQMKAFGRRIIVGDPGRSYFPKSGMTALATYSVPVTTALEDAAIKTVAVWEFDCLGP